MENTRIQSDKYKTALILPMFDESETSSKLTSFYLLSPRMKSNGVTVYQAILFGVVLFIMMYEVALTAKAMNKILTCNLTKFF